MHPALIIAIAVLVTAFCVAHFVYERKQREAYQRAASSLGIEYLNNNPGPLRQLVGQLPMLSKGRAPRFKHVMRTTLADVETYLAVYSYSTGSGSKKGRRYISIVAFRTGVDRAPDFELRSENVVLHTIASFFGKHDIDFEDDTEFSRGYVLKGDDEEAVRAYFTPERRRHLAELEDKPTVESHGDWVVVLGRGRKDRDPAVITQRIERSFAVCEPLL